MTNNKLSGAKIFMTGATGFVGPWFIEALLEENAQVVALVRDRNRHSRFFTSDLEKKVSAVYGDVSDPALLLRILAEYEIDYVVHLASQSIVGISSHDPISTFQTNIAGTWNLLDACRRYSPIKGVLVATSDKVYGHPDSIPCDENTRLSGVNPYEISKVCMDQIALSYHATYNLPVAIARCANIYGGGDFNVNRIVPGAILAAMKNQSPVLRSDGSPVRDYIYIEDAVEGMLRILRQIDQPNVTGQAFNFSMEEPVSVLDLVKRVLKVMKKDDIEPTVLGTAVSEADQLAVDSAKAKNVLGWQNRFSFDEGIGRTVKWYKEQWDKKGDR